MGDIPTAEAALPADAPGPSRPRRVLLACAALLLVYLALSLLNDPHGYLGTDTGGKVATLRAMQHGRTLDPDLGYWAAPWDPTGRLHPLYYTAHFGQRWVNVTTLPALYLAYPLFRLFGYRGALLVPMLGAVLAALAARALVRRLRPGDERQGWVAFWLVGLASPLTVYALDFWEHSLGVALVAWGVVLLLDVAEGRAGWRAAGASGLLFGAAATMRTEALVYGAVATAVAGAVVLYRRRAVVPALAIGMVVAAGLIVPLAANQALERAAIGSSLRAERAAGTVTTATSAGGSRIDEAIVTAASPDAAAGSSSYLAGGALLALLLLFTVRASQGNAGSPLGVGAAVGVVAIYASRFAGGLGFVPGLVAATPLAAVGLALGWRRTAGSAARLVLAVAVGSLPLVWAFQFTGGATPQWAGRYILPSGLLLGAVGITCLPRLTRWAAAFLVVLAVSVTGFGLAWLSVRSHDVGQAAAALARRPEPVLVSRVAHLEREAGWYAGGHQWLTAATSADLADAVRVLDASGTTTFALVAEAGKPAPSLPGWQETATDRQRFITDTWLTITTYVRTG